MYSKKIDPALEDQLHSLSVNEPVLFKHQTPNDSIKERSETRAPVYKFAVLLDPDGNKDSCVVKTIHAHGAKVIISGAESLPKAFSLIIDGYSAPIPAKLAWGKGSEAGIVFQEF